jgi:hypothetical protein
MATYVPSGKAGVPGILLPLALGLISAAAAAAVFHFVGRFFYLVLLFPMLWGVVVGGVTSAGVKKGKCRNAAAGLGAGVVAAVVSYGLFQHFDNLHHRLRFRDEMGKSVQASREELDGFYDEFLKQKYGGSGFGAQLSLRSEAGMNISRSGSGGKDSKPMISGAGMYVYWAVELVIIAGICGFLPLAAAREPFCERCSEWYEKSELAGIVDGRVDDARRALQNKDPAALAACVVRTNPGGALTLEQCPKCSESPVRVKLDSVTRDKKGKEERRTVFEDMWEPKDAAALEGAIGGPPAKPG